MNQQTVQRIISERQRLGLTVEQFAVLLGISAEQQKTIEAGNLDTAPISYGHAIQRAGCDPLFVCGQKDEPQVKRRDLLFDDEAFSSALVLFRRSQQAVDAFVGPGASTTAPELVAALMNATIQERKTIHASDLEDFVEKLASAVTDVGESIAGAIAQATDEHE